MIFTTNDDANSYEDDFGDKIVMVMMTTAAILEISPTSPSRSLIFTNMMAIIMAITFEDDNNAMV